MGKNIVLLSDGTGNSSAQLFKTNVWRLYQALDLTNPARQVAYYDDGVGTSSFKLFAVLGGVFGFGLKRNVLDLYRFACRNYTSDEDRIFGFGFSRGAFTIRVVVGLIASQGLAQHCGNEEQLARDAKDAYRRFRRKFKITGGATELLRNARDGIIDAWRRLRRIPRAETRRFRPVESIQFVGVWDTVDAYGGPSEEIIRAIDYWYWPLSMPDRFLSNKVKRACHALALEDERNAFRPVLWDERYVAGADGKLHRLSEGWEAPKDGLPAIDRERISQVWFVGVHSDVGGSYPQDGLSYVTLDWMIDRALVYGLHLLPLQRRLLRVQVNKFDKLNDSRLGLAGYYRYRPRKLEDIYQQSPYRLSFRDDLRWVVKLWRGKSGLGDVERRDLADPTKAIVVPPPPKVHAAAFERIDARTEGYVPIVLPGEYLVTDRSGRTFDLQNHPPAAAPIFESADQAQSRSLRQEGVWNLVWGRRLVYFGTVFSSLYLVLLPVLNAFTPDAWVPVPASGAGSPFEFLLLPVEAAASFLPAVVKPWLDAFRDAPSRFAFGALLVTAGLYFGGRLQDGIRDRMRAIWRAPGSGKLPKDWIYRLRSSGKYRAVFYVLNHWVLPTISAILMLVLLLYVVFVLASRLSFGAANVLGFVCRAEKAAVEGPVSFETKSLCTPLGVRAKKGEIYRVTLKITQPWEDGHKREESDPVKARGIATGPNGFGWEKTTWKQVPGIPLRRLISSNWFQTVVRVGQTGIEEHALKFEPTDACACKDGPRLPAYVAQFRARNDGDLFIFVNDSITLFPRPFDYFYTANNAGVAEVTVEHVPN